MSPTELAKQVKPEIYVSVDIEADGPNPGDNSMISLGAAAFVRGNRVPIDTFEINFEPMSGAVPDRETMAWWAKQDPAVWAHVTKDPVDPNAAMRRFSTWATALPGKLVLCTYPSWDLAWISFYFGRFCHKNPFGISGLDIKSFAMGKLGMETFRGTTKENMPAWVKQGTPAHTHRGLDDAIEQGIILINLLAME